MAFWRVWPSSHCEAECVDSWTSWVTCVCDDTGIVFFAGFYCWSIQLRYLHLCLHTLSQGLQLHSGHDWFHDSVRLRNEGSKQSTEEVNTMRWTLLDICGQTWSDHYLVELHGRMDFVKFSWAFIQSYRRELHSKLPPWKFIHMWLREIHPLLWDIA